MKARRLLLVVQVLAVLLAGCLLILAAEARARGNALTAFANFRPVWPDAWRAPVEHQAVEVLGRLLSAPETDPELARAALGVMRQSSSWTAMAPQVSSQLRGVLEARLAEGADERLRTAWELFALSDPPDLDLYRERIIALGGDRSALADNVSQAVMRLRTADPAMAEAILDELSSEWAALLGPFAGRQLPWLARLSPAIVDAESSAQEAVLHHRRRLLEPYGLRLDATYGRMQPDHAMIDWLDHQAREVNASDDVRRTRLAQVDLLIRRHAAGIDEEPVVEVATRIALRHHALPWSALVVGLGVLAVLGAGLVRALLRLRRGPLPIDVNAETMENVEPIDLDTDAETRSRSSGSITDVG